eukprot:NODE_50_length_31184_cov_0.705099.p6 type:complete len:417 gc:universal NODE_50_length_31184_cov_0.705099:19372-18122(-)
MNNFKKFHFVIHPLFFKTLADKKINEWKLRTTEITIYAEMINQLLRIQDFNMKAKDGVVGRLIVHDSKNLFLNCSPDESLFDADNFFELHVYADIKNYVFEYKIYYIEILNLENTLEQTKPEKFNFSDLKKVHSYDGNSHVVKNSLKANFTILVQNVLNIAKEGEIVNIYSSHQPQIAYKVIKPGIPKKTLHPDKLQIVDLKSILDPTTLVYEASMLNLSLMKWRLVPDLDLEKHKGLRCLILGVGTLGCNVIRALIGWGVTTFTLVDSGLVSYSNPVRQSLFTVEDVGKPKVAAAKENILKIAPYCTIYTESLRIPMPDHPVDKQNVDMLWKLIKTNDTIFLLTDSRESRWLPTVLGRYEEKLVLTAALGFDSLLALRHSKEEGCYFCSDVVAPVNVNYYSFSHLKTGLLINSVL